MIAKKIKEIYNWEELQRLFHFLPSDFVKQVKEKWEQSGYGNIPPSSPTILRHRQGEGKNHKLGQCIIAVAEDNREKLGFGNIIINYKKTEV